METPVDEESDHGSVFNNVRRHRFGNYFPAGFLIQSVLVKLWIWFLTHVVSVTSLTLLERWLIFISAGLALGANRHLQWNKLISICGISEAFLSLISQIWENEVAICNVRWTSPNAVIELRMRKMITMVYHKSFVNCWEHMSNVCYLICRKTSQLYKRS